MINPDLVILIACVCFLFGMIVSRWLVLRELDGYFFVNLINPEDEMFKLQIDIPLEKLPEAKYLIFKVKKIQ